MLHVQADLSVINTHCEKKFFCFCTGQQGAELYRLHAAAQIFQALSVSNYCFFQRLQFSKIVSAADSKGK